MEPLIPIGQFAKLSSLSIQALRRYADGNLLVPAWIDPETGYRYYRKDQVERAWMIRLLRAADMPLAVIATFLDAPSREGLQAHRRDLVARQAERDWVLRYLDRVLSQEDQPMSHVVKLKDVPAQPYIGRRATVSITELGRFLADSIREMRAETPAAGPPYAIFHKEVTPETRGDVEVRLPVAEFDASSAVMPAATVAYTIVEGEETDFPAILGAYDAVADWVNKNGRELDGPPREIYLSDHFAGETPKMEIAWTVR